jgi:arylsulfatase A-like enzyme
MVRTDKFKLIVYPKANKIRLFNVQEDPAEINDLADNPEFKMVKKELAERLKKQQQLMDDPLDLHPIFPELF